MTDRILERYASREGPNGANSNQPQDDNEIDDLGTFGFLRGSRERATMLELRKKDGSILAVAYGYVDQIEFDPSTGITLRLAGRKIQVRGRNLNAEVHSKVRLFEAICRHRVPWVQEINEHDGMAVASGATVIDVIEW